MSTCGGTRATRKVRRPASGLMMRSAQQHRPTRDEVGRGGGGRCLPSCDAEPAARGVVDQGQADHDRQPEHTRDDDQPGEAGRVRTCMKKSTTKVALSAAIAMATTLFMAPMSMKATADGGAGQHEQTREDAEIDAEREDVVRLRAVFCLTHPCLPTK